MVITQTQTYLGLLAFTALVGGVRGWRREALTLAVLLAALMFVKTGGGVLLANLFTHGTTGIESASSTTAYAPTTTCVDNLPAALANLSFSGLTFFGYRVGRFVITNARLLAAHRFTGMVIGAANGAVIAYYVSTYLLDGRTITLGTPGPTQASEFLPEVLGVGIVAVLGVAFMMSQANKSRAHAGGETAAH